MISLNERFKLLNESGDVPTFVAQLTDPTLLGYPDDAMEELAEFIKRECSQWMNQVGDAAVYRGHGVKQRVDTITDLVHILTVRSDRRPRDSTVENHDSMNAEIAERGLTANRNNSVFVTGALRIANKYGNLYIAIPIGDFQFTWSPNVADPVAMLASGKKKKSFDWRGDDGSILQAIKSKHEIMIHADRVLLVEESLWHTLHDEDFL